MNQKQGRKGQQGPQGPEDTGPVFFVPAVLAVPACFRRAELLASYAEAAATGSAASVSSVPNIPWRKRLKKAIQRLHISSALATI